MLGPWKVLLLGGVAFLEEVNYCGSGLLGPVLKFCPVQKRLSSWLPLDQDVELSVPFTAPCLRGHCHASCHGDKGLNL